MSESRKMINMETDTMGRPVDRSTCVCERNSDESTGGACAGWIIRAMRKPLVDYILASGHGASSQLHSDICENFDILTF